MDDGPRGPRGEDRWATLAEQAATDARTRANGTAQLCCGLGGQAYAMLAMHRQTGERRWLLAATELAGRAVAVAGSREGSLRLPASLHKGEVGLAVLAADVRDPSAAGMPFFGTEE